MVGVAFLKMTLQGPHLLTTYLEGIGAMLFVGGRPSAIARDKGSGGSGQDRQVGDAQEAKKKKFSEENKGHRSIDSNWKNLQ